MLSFSSSVLLQHSSSNLEYRIYRVFGVPIFFNQFKKMDQKVFGAPSLTGYLVVHVGDSAYSGQISMANSGDRLKPQH